MGAEDVYHKHLLTRLTLSQRNGCEEVLWKITVLTKIAEVLIKYMWQLMFLVKLHTDVLRLSINLQVIGLSPWKKLVYNFIKCRALSLTFYLGLTFLPAHLKSTCETAKKNEKCFLHHPKSFFIFKILKFFSWLFGHVEITSWLERSD